MLAHSIPVIIMFLITILTASLFFVPITKFPRKNKLINFYWVGFWVFLVAIAAFAGGENTLMLTGVDTSKISTAILAGICASFVVFVIFGWFRLSAKAIAALFVKGQKKLGLKA